MIISTDSDIQTQLCEADILDDFGSSPLSRDVCFLSRDDYKACRPFASSTARDKVSTERSNSPNGSNRPC